MIPAARFVSYLLALALAPALALPASARVLTVTKTADTLDLACDQDCSLREAVTAANLSKDVRNVIVLPAGTYTLTRQGAGEEQGATGDLDVFSPVLLVGAGADASVIDGNGLDRIFDLRASTELHGVTLRNGRVEGDGGGILLRQIGVPVLVLARSVVSGNRAESGGDGGGIASESRRVGAVRLASSAVLDNQAGGDGGGIAALDAALTNVTVSGNRAGGSGGGLFLPEGATLSAVTVAFNQAGVSGGGLEGGPETVFRASVLSGNTAPQGPDCSGASSSGYNRLGTAAVAGTCALDPLTDETGLGTLLAPLALDTPVPGHPLLPGGPAESAVPALACEPADQAGQPRPVPCDAGALESVEPRLCIPGGSALCLQEGRFRVTAAWRTKAGEMGLARAVPLTADTGIYWFFGPENLELTVKVLDGCAVNDRWWVFSTGLTDVGVTLTVEDLAAGTVKTYTHPAGTTYAPRLDTSAFATCASAAPEHGTGTAVSNPAGSTVLAVTRTDDPAPGACDHDCSLREAVIAANARPGLEVIVLGPGVYTLERPGRVEDAGLLGDLDSLDDLVILGAGADRTVIDGGGHDRVLDQPSFYPALEVHGVTIRNGHAMALPGDLGYGGGIRADGSAVLAGTHLTGNRAEGFGGGIVAGFLEVRSSTISGNEAEQGGGILTWGSTVLENVTVSGNHARQFGGGVYAYSLDTEIRHATVTGNRARVGGGLYQDTDYACPGPCGEVFLLDHSVVAGNSADEEAPDCVGFNSTVETDGFNVIGVGNFCSPEETDRAGTPGAPLDPRLTPLANRGGTTPTHGLEPGSPAVDIGGAHCLGADQRGRPRTGACDAGAFELGRAAGCENDGEALCLGDRFRLTVRWATSEGEGQGTPHPLTRDTGTFWFFGPDNLELTVKVLDGCAVNQRYWVFLSGLTDVEVRVDVEDTATGAVKTYTHDGDGPFATRLDTDAFACP